MINPKLLTKEAGFIVGTVVEINGTEVGRIIKITNSFLHLNTFVFGIPFDTIDSIRILTGPMSIWNHAPEWATYLIQGGGEFCFGIKIPNWWDGGSSKIQLRPWWAITQKERE